MNTGNSGAFATHGTKGKSAAPGVPGAAVLVRAENLATTFAARLAGVPYGGRGIPMSEMFFLFAAVAPLEPGLVLESGRGWAQSTLVLGHVFPTARVVSLESEPASEHASPALARVSHLPNVDCRFGDSRQLLPDLLEPGCVVLIDGPKEFRALKLALRLLATGLPAAVFLHDFHRRSPARRWADRHLPHAFASDAPEWVRRYSRLDTGFILKDEWQDEAPEAGTHTEEGAEHFRGYGPTLLCIPARPRLRYGRLLAHLTIHRHLTRLRERLRRGRRSTFL